MRKQSGITLIALVITIIVLLILAGVSISMVIGNNGVLKQASNSVVKTKEEEEKEQVELAYVAAKAMKLGGSVTATDIDNELKANGVDATANGENPIIVEFTKTRNRYQIKDGKAIAIGTGSIEETVSTDAKYFSFELDEDTKTAKITGIKDEYAVKGYYQVGETIYGDVNRAINDNGIYITEVIVPYEYVDDNNNTKYTVTTLGSDVFGDSNYHYYGYEGNYNEMFTKIIIPNTITIIEQGAFTGCKRLTQIEIPSSVKEIGEGAFFGCSSLESIIIPSDVTSIGNDTFYRCSSLESIIISQNLTSIGYSAFNSCSSLESIIIPSGVQSIEPSAFSGCINLTNIEVDANNTKYDSRNNCNAIIETSTNTLIRGCKNTTILNTVTSIGNSAFSGCTGLTSITIPSSVTSIGTSAFFGCTGLTSITIPSNVTTIKDNVFYDCTGLTNITIPVSVTSIESSAFSGCSELTTVNYTGTQEQWNIITISFNNDPLTNATKVYNYVP